MKNEKPVNGAPPIDMDFEKQVRQNSGAINTSGANLEQVSQDRSKVQSQQLENASGESD